MGKKQEIINAAFNLFCEKGYHLSVSELANAVGIKTPSLYSHYETKDQIIELMIREEIERYFSCLEEKINQIEHLRCSEAMKSLYFFVVEYFSDYKRLRFWRSIPLIPNEHLKTVCSQLIAEKDSIYTQQMKLCFTKGIESGEIRPDVSESALYLYLCMIQGVMDGMLLYPKRPGENIFAVKVFDAYWDGLKG
ncbi:MAG: helix-turn-helix domain-containing protein [Bacillota bacterium]